MFAMSTHLNIRHTGLTSAGLASKEVPCFTGFNPAVETAWVVLQTSFREAGVVLRVLLLEMHVSSPAA